jgi:hypothetical protein
MYWEKVVHKFALLLSLKKLPKVNNHPVDESSPNLVTLLYMYCLFQFTA